MAKFFVAYPHVAATVALS